MQNALEGKTGIIFGVANKRSIAWGCARALSQAGMRLALTYANDRMESSVRGLAEELPGSLVLPCDVTREAEVDAVFEELGNAFGHLDTLVHAIAYANRDDLQGHFRDTSKEGYMIAQEVSAFSLLSLSKRALPLMEGRDGSIITMTYLGAERVIRNYNVMGVAKAALEANVRYLASDLGPHGVRVNAISAGPLRTLSASGVKDFGSIIDHIAEIAPLRRNITTEDVGAACLFLASPGSRSITGTTLHVDAGFHIMGA